MLEIKFDTENAAFEDLENETAWILRKIADQIENGDRKDSFFRTILDSNGNDVGRWRLKPWR